MWLVVKAVINMKLNSAVTIAVTFVTGRTITYTGISIDIDGGYLSILPLSLHYCTVPPPIQIPMIDVLRITYEK
jgi:hypothetical protein